MKKFLLIILILILILIFSTSTVYAEPRIDNQGNSKMCAVYSVCNAIEEQMVRDGLDVPPLGFSKDVLWNDSRKIENRKAGIHITTALDLAVSEGLHSPSTRNETFKIKGYSEIPIPQIQEYVSNGAVVIIASSFQSKNWSDGIILYSKSEKITNFHGTFLIGYDADKELKGQKGFFEGVNSYGKSYGFNGRYYMSGEFLVRDGVTAYIIQTK